MTRSEALAWGRGDRRRLSTRDFPTPVLALVYAREHGFEGCTACRDQRLQTPDSEPLEVDHIQPLSRGGDNQWSNLRILCRAHNRGKNARPSCPSTPRWARGLPGSPTP